MGLTDLRSLLRRHRRLAVDSNIFIYQLELNPLYADLADEVFLWVEQPGHTAFTSTITVTEVLIQPLRDGDNRRIRQFYGLFSTYPNLLWIAPDLLIADFAARIRAQHRLRTPDALQAATAIQSGATGFVTNDFAFERVAEFETLVLDRVR